MFEHNLKLLENVNKSLAFKLSKISLDDALKSVSAIKNEKGEYILACNNKYVDDTPSPLEASKSIYEECIKSATSRHDFIVIFGLGLGNLLDYTHQKSMCNLIVYEPDLNILRFTFEYVDLSKYFADKRLFIANNLNECTNFIEEKYLLDDKIEFVYLKNYLMQHSSEFTVLTERIFEVCQNKIIDMNTTKKLSKLWINNTFVNLSGLNVHYPINLLENKFDGKTALVLGAGPSLKENIEKIKENREKFVIFAVHRTLETLRVNGIVPDFCVIVDADYVKHSITNDLKYLSEINVISDIKSDTFIKKLPFKNFFTYYSSNSTFAQKLEIKLSNLIKTLETGGTSAICAYRCAKFMGCKNIVFAGIDLAFKNDVAYCDGKIVAANTQTSVKIQNVVRQTTKVKSITGEYVQTRADYASFIKQFENIFSTDKASVLYNITDFGAFISGMKYMPLEEILENISSDLVDVNGVLNTVLSKNSDLIDQVQKATIEILREEKQKVTPIVDLINEWFEMYSQHPQFFDYAAKIITKITSTMILQEYIQMELIRFSKLIFSKDEDYKRTFLNDLFKVVLSYDKTLYNLI